MSDRTREIVERLAVAWFDRVDADTLCIDAKIELERLAAERDEARGVLASLADCLNTWARENGLREVQRYEILQEMRAAVDALGLNGNRFRADRDRLASRLDASEEQLEGVSADRERLAAENEALRRDPVRQLAEDTALKMLRADCDRLAAELEQARALLEEVQSEIEEDGSLLQHIQAYLAAREKEPT